MRTMKSKEKNVVKMIRMIKNKINVQDEVKLNIFLRIETFPWHGTYDLWSNI